MCVFYIGAIFYSRLLKKNLTVEIIPKEEQGWKTIRKWADIWRSANSVQQITKWRAYCKSCTTTVFISNDRESARLTTTARILATIVKYFEKNIHWTWGVKLNPLSLLFQLARYHRNNTNKRLYQWLSNFSKKPHVFSSYVLYAHAGVTARAHILLIRLQTTRVFRIFGTSAQFINREILVFPSVFFFENGLIS